jgi:hypothetical protein
MKDTIKKLAITLAFFGFFCSVFTSTTGAHSTNTTYDMLLFVSPQYSHDQDLLTAIHTYTSAVQEDLGWHIRILYLSEIINDFKSIDTIIEYYYTNHLVKACLMVGEDIDTALAGTSGYMTKPSIVPWYTIGGEEAYDLSDKGIVNKPYKMDICVSLLYPTAELSYDVKTSQLIAAFTKFTHDRNTPLTDTVSVFESSALNTNSKSLYQHIAPTVIYHENPSNNDIIHSLNGQYAMYVVHGHSNPAGTDANTQSDGWFSANLVDSLDTPFFAADGCYVSGWWTDTPNSATLSPSIDATWYGSKIFTSKAKVMVLGLLSQTGYSTSVSFIENALPAFINGGTLAESMIGHTYIGDNALLLGDPTFHFSLF